MFATTEKHRAFNSDTKGSIPLHSTISAPLVKRDHLCLISGGSRFESLRVYHLLPLNVMETSLLRKQFDWVRFPAAAPLT